MPGGFIPHKGSSIPPNKVWMSPLADKFTLLLPILESGANANKLSTFTSAPACLLPGAFNFWNASAGGFITAPDGTTNTFQAIIEDSSTNQHYIQAGFTYWQGLWPTMRLAGIYKAGVTRTRVAFQLVDLEGGTASVGFDLSGGQIAYGGTFSGTHYFSFSNQTITPLGGGVYLCYVDVFALDAQNSSFGIGNGWNIRVCIDSGSGTAAASLNYAGNGTGSIFGWKQSILPVQAWGINNTTFFNDFNDLTKIDVNNTQVPGYDFYVQGGCWAVAHGTATGQGWFEGGTWAPGDLTISSPSVLKLPARDRTSINTESPYLVSYCNPGPFGEPAGKVTPQGVGTGWKMPLVFETRMSWSYPNYVSLADISFWFGFVEWLQQVSASTVNTSNSINGGEIDPFEIGASGSPYGPSSSATVYSSVIGQVGWWPATPSASHITTPHTWSFIGQPPLSTSFVSGGNFVGIGTWQYLGNYYTSITNANTIPPSGQWVSYSYPTSSGDPMISLDFTQMHTMTVFMLPYNRVTGDRGCIINFFDGAYVGALNSWTPNPGLASSAFDVSSPYFHTVDWQHIFMQYSSTFNQTGSNYDMFVDYAQIMQ